MQEETTLNADFLGSCMALAVYDPQRNEAYLGHFPTINNEGLEKELNEYLEDVTQNTRPPYEVFLGGTMNTNADPMENDYTIKDARETAEDVVENYFGEDYVCDWSDGIARSRVVVHPDHGIMYEEEVDEREKTSEVDATFQKYLEPQ